MAPHRVARDESADLWGAFWRESAADGCTLAFPPEARERIARGWRDALGGVPRDAALLDVACGKGAVMRHAAAVGVSDLRGVDLAPATALAGNGFDIVGGVDARALPFAPRSFDAVVSQFGVEYAGLDAAADEAARVCRGSLILLVHAADGVVVAHAAEQAAHATMMDDDLSAFARLKAHLEGPTEASARDVDALLATIAEHAHRADNLSLLDGVYRAALAFQDDPDPLGGVDRLAASVREHAERMTALRDAAPDRARVDALAHRLESASFAVAVRAEGGDGSPLIGRWIVAHRRKGSRT